MQSKWESFREALSNTGSAFLLSLLAHKFIVSEQLVRYEQAGGDQTDWLAAASVTAFYTLLSLARNFIVRRLFDWRQRRQAKNAPRYRSPPQLGELRRHLYSTIDKKGK